MIKLNTRVQKPVPWEQQRGAFDHQKIHRGVYELQLHVLELTEAVEAQAAELAAVRLELEALKKPAAKKPAAKKETADAEA